MSQSVFCATLSCWQLSPCVQHCDNVKGLDSESQRLESTTDVLLRQISEVRSEGTRLETQLKYVINSASLPLWISLGEHMERERLLANLLGTQPSVWTISPNPLPDTGVYPDDVPSDSDEDEKPTNSLSFSTGQKRENAWGALTFWSELQRAFEHHFGIHGDREGLVTVLIAVGCRLILLPDAQEARTGAFCLQKALRALQTASCETHEEWVRQHLRIATLCLHLCRFNNTPLKLPGESPSALLSGDWSIRALNALVSVLLLSQPATQIGYDSDDVSKWVCDMEACDRPIDPCAHLKLWAAYCPSLLSVLAFALLSTSCEKPDVATLADEKGEVSDDTAKKAQIALWVLSLLPRPQYLDFCLMWLALTKNPDHALSPVKWNSICNIFYHACTFSLGLGVVELGDILSLRTSDNHDFTENYISASDEAQTYAFQYFSSLKLVDEWHSQPVSNVELD